MPWAYFHLLGLMTFLTLFIGGYVLTGLAQWPITLAVHAIVCLVVMGMKNLAVAMADPFGDDVIDFDIEKSAPHDTPRALSLPPRTLPRMSPRTLRAQVPHGHLRERRRAPAAPAPAARRRDA